jgi:cell shape-determining protein MreC
MSPIKKKQSFAQKDAASPKKKSRMKEAKETRQLFETIAKKLLAECTSNTNHKLEEFCVDLINRKFTEMRQDVVIMESSLSTRIAQIEHKVNDMGTKLADLTTDLVRQNTLLREDYTKLSHQTTEGLESERQKRLAVAKKVQAIVDTQAEHCKAFASAGNKECMAAITALNEDFRVQSKELTRLKESVDDV